MSDRDHLPQREVSAQPDDENSLTRRETIHRAGLLTLGVALGIPTAGLAGVPTRSDSRFQFKLGVNGGRDTLATFEVDEPTADLLVGAPEKFRLDWYDRDQSGSRPISSLRFDKQYQLKLL